MRWHRLDRLVHLCHELRKPIGGESSVYFVTDHHELIRYASGHSRPIHKYLVRCKRYQKRAPEHVERLRVGAGYPPPIPRRRVLSMPSLRAFSRSASTSSRCANEFVTPCQVD
jgi:hypothetical protein